MKKNRLVGLSGHTHLGGVAGVGFVEERPDTRLDSLPAGQLTAVKLLVQSELLHNVLVGRPVGVQVQPVK